MRAAILLLSLALGPATAQRSNALIRNLVTRLKSVPKHYSISPSYTSDRRVEVLPVNSLPLQSDPSPSLTDVITGNLGKFETGGEEVGTLEAGEEEPVALGSQHRPRQKKGRRERRPGRAGARPARLSRPGGPPPRRERPRPPKSDRPRQPGRRGPQEPLGQAPVEEFFPSRQGDGEQFYLGAVKPARPGRRGASRQPGPGRRKPEGGPPRRKPESAPSRRKPPVPGPPRTKRKPSRPTRGPPGPRRRKPGTFRPPRKIYNGFEPSFESSNPYDDSPIYVEDPGKRRKRKRRPRPAAPKPSGLRPFKPEATRPARPVRPPPSTPTDFNPFNKHGNFENQPGFDSNSHKSPMSINKPGPPYETALSPFSDEEPRFGADPRPKRQQVGARPAPDHRDYFNLVPTGGQEDNFGFFQNAQENFPGIESFGIGWDSQKIRRKRATGGLIRYTPPSRRRRGQRAPQRPQPSRRQGPAGFWDDAEFDAEFFNGGAPPSYSSFEAFSQQNTQPNQRFQGSRRPSRQPHIAPKKYETGGKFPGYDYSTSYHQPEPQYQAARPAPVARPPQDNAILGSGNFEILKGGTFYDENDYQSSQFSYNSRPQAYGYGQNNIFNNFRDFADIKGERKQRRPERNPSYY